MFSGSIGIVPYENPPPLCMHSVAVEPASAAAFVELDDGVGRGSWFSYLFWRILGFCDGSGFEPQSFRQPRRISGHFRMGTFYRCFPVFVCDFFIELCSPMVTTEEVCRIEWPHENRKTRTVLILQCRTLIRPAGIVQAVEVNHNGSQGTRRRSMPPPAGRGSSVRRPGWDCQWRVAGSKASTGDGVRKWQVCGVL